MKGLAKKLKDAGRAAMLVLPLIGFSNYSKAQFYGDQVLRPSQAPNYREKGKETLDSHGSGDVDGNGEINSIDYNLAKKGMTNYRSDVNGDGATDSLDLALIEKYVNQEIKYLPGHWNYLQTKTERDSWLEKIIKIDNTYARKLIDSRDFAMQATINFAGIENIKSLGINYSKIDTTNNGIFNIPMYVALTQDTSQKNHHILAVLTGDSAQKFSDWYFIEPQTGKRVFPGDSSMDKGGLARISRDVYISNGNKFYHLNFPILTFGDLAKDTPVVKISKPDLEESRDLFPINFNISLKDTTLNYPISQNDIRFDTLYNLLPGDSVLVTDSSNRIMNKGFEQENYDHRRYFHIMRGPVIDTLVVQKVQVRDLEKPKWDKVENLEEYVTNLTPIDSSYLSAKDNSDLNLIYSVTKNSTQGKDSTKLDFYEYKDSFNFSVSDVTGNNSDTFLTREVKKPNTLLFNYFPKDVQVNGDTSINNTGIPIGLDTLMKSNLVNITYVDTFLGNGLYKREFTGTGEVRGDTIKKSQLIQDMPVSLEQIASDNENKLLPNPTNGMLTLDLEDKDYQKTVYSVYDMQGRMVEEGKDELYGEENLQIDLSDQAPGSYILQVQTQDGLITKRIVKQ